MPTPGDTLGPDGRYLVQHLLGSGGMADVFRALDTRLDRPVAIKLLRDAGLPSGSSVGTDSDPVSRFRSEARTLGRLNHPGLVPVLDAGTTDDVPFLVLGLVDGPSLSQALHDTDGAGLELGVVTRIGAQVAAALAYCHAAGVVHRDVKPGNVLLTQVGGAESRALLSDFGVARILDDPARLTRTGFTVGTAAYLAPEQVRGEQVTPAADVYSLGLVLIESVSGRRAYPGPAAEAAVARLHASPVLPQGLPDDWVSLLVAMTALDPAARPSAAEVAERMGRLAGVRVVLPVSTGTGDATEVFPAPTTVVPVPEQSRPRRRVALLVAAVATAGLLAVGTLLATHESAAPDQPASDPTPVPSPAATTPSSTTSDAAVVVSSSSPTVGAGTKPGKTKPGKTKPGKVGPGKTGPGKAPKPPKGKGKGAGKGKP